MARVLIPRLPRAPVFARIRAGIAAAAACAGLAAVPALHAQPAGGTACFDVEVNGQRAPASYECLSQKLAAPRQAPPAAGTAAGALASESIAHRPSNQLGLFNRAATGHRMGDQFGRSAFPQRPDEGPGAAPIVTPRR